jgi:hypothetical protein
MPLYGTSFVSLIKNQAIHGIKNFTQNLGLGTNNPQAKIHIHESAANTETTALKISNPQTGINQGLNLNLDSLGNTIFKIDNNTISSPRFKFNINNYEDVAIMESNPNSLTSGYLISSNGYVSARQSNHIPCGFQTVSNYDGVSGSANEFDYSFIEFFTQGGFNDEIAFSNITAKHESLTQRKGTKLLFNVRGESQTDIEALSIRGTGNILIGTTTDNNVDKLQVNGSIGASNTIKLPSSGNTNGLIFGNQSTTGFNLGCIFDYWGVLKLNASNGMFTINTPSNTGFFKAVAEGRIILGITNASDNGVDTLQVSGSSTIKNFTDAQDVLKIVGSASQSGNLQSWRNSSDTVLSAVTPTGKLNILTPDTPRNLGLSVSGTTVFTSNPTGSTRCFNLDPFIYLKNTASTVPFYGANLKIEFGTSNQGGANTASSNNSVVTAANIYSLISNPGGGSLTIANNIGASIMADVGGNLSGVTITNNIGLQVNGTASKGTTTITNAYGIYVGRPQHGVNRYAMLLEAPTGGTINWSLLSQGRINISDTTAAVSSTTGALVVSGGIGLGGNLNLSGTITTPSSITTSTLVNTPFVSATLASGTNAAGNSLVLATGTGTGNAPAAAMIFRTADQIASGSASQPSSEKMRLAGNGNLLLNVLTDDNINKLQVNGAVFASVFRQSPNWIPPASAASPGIAGEFGFSQGFVYYCWSNNNWVRTAFSIF